MANLELNIGLLRGFNLQRKRRSESGQNEFSGPGLINNWVLRASNQLEDLDVHYCSCIVPVICWEGEDNPLEPEYIVEEFDVFPISRNFTITEQLSNDIVLWMDKANYNFTQPSASGQAQPNFDYNPLLLQILT